MSNFTTITNSAGRAIRVNGDGHAHGTMPVAITVERMPSLIRAAQSAVAAGYVLEGVTLPKMTASANLEADASGNVGSEVRRRRWALAYLMSCNLFGVTPGEAYVLPCYLCGELFDAFTMDSEHMVSEVRGGTSTPDNMLLACSLSNSLKGDYADVSKPVLARIAALAYGHGFPRGAGSLRSLWTARPRRKTYGQTGAGIQHSRRVTV